MIDETKYVFRDATIRDVDFLSHAIVEAKKGGSNMVGMANLFELTEDSFKYYVRRMLEEEIDGCDFSVSSFIIAEYNGKPVSTFGGWAEGENEDNLPSSLLKANLISFVLPRENILKAQERTQIVSDLQIERTTGSYQLEYGYTIPEHRGHHLIGQLIDLHIKRASCSNLKVKKMQVLVYNNNIPALTAYEKKGFKVIREYKTDNPDIFQYYPYNKELLLEKVL